MYSDIKSIHVDKCAQVFRNKYHYTNVQIITKDDKKWLGNEIHAFIQNIGIPDELVTKNHQSMKGGKTFLQKVGQD